MNLRILSLEDSVQDFELLEYKLLSAGFDLNMKRVENEADYTDALREKAFDIILIDFNLPQFDAFSALELHKNICPETPIICVSGSIGEEKAIELLKSGAVDYVLKDRLERLPFAIKRALDDAKDKAARLEAEERLKLSEERFRRVSSTISDISYSCYKTGSGSYIIDWMTGATEVITGYSIQEIIQQKCWGNVVVPEDRKLFFENVSDLAPGTSAKCELRLRHKNESIVWVESYAECVVYQDKNAHYVYGCLVDITRRKRAEEALLLSEQKFSMAFHSAAHGLVISEIATGKILEVNESFLRMSGYEMEEVVGKSTFDLNMWLDYALREKLITGLKRHQKVHNIELPFRSKKGDIFTTLYSAELIVVNNEQILLSSLADVTDRKRMIDELIAAKEKAEEMNKIKNNFFANMSHELRTPLIGILGFSELLEDELRNNPSHASMANTVKISGQRLMRTLNLILDISKLETDKLQVRSNKCNIVELLKNDVELFSAAFLQKGIDYTFTFNRDVINCNIDSGLFDHVVNNLINNALKFTETGRVTIKAESLDELAVVTVEDTGIGIEKEKLAIIWEEFRQVSEGFNRSHEGTGLGLTIAKKYTELMGGNIEVDSEPGKGTTFTVAFPLSKQQHESETASPLTNESSLDTTPTVQKLKSVLYVEDDDVAANVIRAFLSDICTIENVADGTQALEMAASRHFDIILMDINLGYGINGIEVTKQIRKMPEYRNTPIVAVTAYALEGDKEEFLQAGCSHYIAKPFTKSEITKLINSIISE